MNWTKFFLIIAISGFMGWFVAGEWNFPILSTLAILVFLTLVILTIRRNKII